MFVPLSLITSANVLLLIYVLPQDSLPFFPLFVPLNVCQLMTAWLTGPRCVSLSLLLSSLLLSLGFLLLLIPLAGQPHLTLSCLAIGRLAFY